MGIENGLHTRHDFGRGPHGIGDQLLEALASQRDKLRFRPLDVGFHFRICHRSVESAPQDGDALRRQTGRCQEGTADFGTRDLER